MKKKSLKVQVQELAKNEMKNTKGGLAVNDHLLAVGQAKTAYQTGKKKDQTLMF